MGYVLTHGLWDSSPSHYAQYPAIQTTQRFRTKPPNTKSLLDFRDVVLVRNWYDSLLSGYLYHKAGYECHLNQYGQPQQGQWRNTNFADTLSIAKDRLDDGKYDNQTLCHFLASAPEEVGMLVYMDWVSQTLISFIAPLFVLLPLFF